MRLPVELDDEPPSVDLYGSAKTESTELNVTATSLNETIRSEASTTMLEHHFVPGSQWFLYQN